MVEHATASVEYAPGQYALMVPSRNGRTRLSRNQYVGPVPSSSWRDGTATAGELGDLALPPTTVVILKTLSTGTIESLGPLSPGQPTPPKLLVPAIASTFTD